MAGGAEVSGKGDNPRPLSVTPEQFAANFDAIDWNAREREAAWPLDGRPILGNEPIDYPLPGTPLKDAP